MDLKAKFISLFSKSTTKRGDQEAQGQPVLDLREHERYESKLLTQNPAIHVSAGNMKAIEVISISYGGFAVGLQAGFSPSEDHLQGTMNVLGESCSITFKTLYRTGEKIGCQFIHADARILVFLRSAIEYLRRSTTLTKIDEKHLKQQAPAAGQASYFRGEGPIDIVVTLNERNNEMASGQITFRDGDQYLSVHCKDGNMQTLVAIDREGIGARMAPTESVDLGIIRRAVLLMYCPPAAAGMEKPTKGLFEAMLRTLAAHGKLGLKKPA